MNLIRNIISKWNSHETPVLFLYFDNNDRLYRYLSELLCKYRLFLIEPHVEQTEFVLHFSKNTECSFDPDVHQYMTVELSGVFSGVFSVPSLEVPSTRSMLITLPLVSALLQKRKLKHLVKYLKKDIDTFFVEYNLRYIVGTLSTLQ